MRITPIRPKQFIPFAIEIESLEEYWSIRMGIDSLIHDKIEGMKLYKKCGVTLDVLITILEHLDTVDLGY